MPGPNPPTGYMCQQGQTWDQGRLMCRNQDGSYAQPIVISGYHRIGPTTTQPSQPPVSSGPPTARVPIDTLQTEVSAERQIRRFAQRNPQAAAGLAGLVIGGLVAPKNRVRGMAYGAAIGVAVSYAVRQMILGLGS